MKQRIVLWGFAGIIVAACWALLSLAIPISSQPILLSLARLTCPIVNVGFLFHFGIKWYWVLLANLPVYTLIGLMVEGLRQSRSRLQAHGR
jgi:hypothetical protein